MYELFTLGGGTYLVDLLNAVAAITSGGAYITLAQLAGVAGLAWVLPSMQVPGRGTEKPNDRDSERLRPPTCRTQRIAMR